MNENIQLAAEIIFIVIFTYLGLRFALRYFRIFVFFMLNIKFSWIDHIDKPRILVYILFYPSSFYFYSCLIKDKELTPLFIFLNILFLITSMTMLFFCHFSWDKKFYKTFIPVIQNKFRTILKPSYLINESDKGEAIFQRFLDGKYLEGDFFQFEAMLNLSNNFDVHNDKIIWIHKSRNNKSVINRQTLVEFLSIIYDGFENLGNKEIVEFCKKYFCLEGQKEFEISSKNVTDWKENKTKSIRDVSNLIKG